MAPSAREAEPVAAATVATQETHAPPVLALSPAQQIATSIVDAAGKAAAAQAPARAAPVPEQPARALQPLQVLDIKLSPPDLGEVTVKMRLSGGAKLELHIEVGQKDTVPLLGKDGDALSTQLQSSGYTVDALTIKTAESTGTSTQQQPHQQHGSQQEQTQGQASGFQPSSFAQQGGSGAGAGSAPA